MKTLLVMVLALALPLHAMAASGAREARIGEAIAHLHEAARAEQTRLGAPAVGTCRPTLVNMCLLSRFEVVAVWENPYDGTGLLHPAGALQLTNESGYMWFQSATNMEIPMKLLNFCAGEGTFKLFAAGLSDFGVSIGVLDLATGIQRNYINPKGVTFNTIIDQHPPFPCF